MSQKNVMRENAFQKDTDEKSEYDFATCQSLPHKTEIYGDPDTTSGGKTQLGHSRQILLI